MRLGLVLRRQKNHIRVGSYNCACVQTAIILHGESQLQFKQTLYKITNRMLFGPASKTNFYIFTFHVKNYFRLIAQDFGPSRETTYYFVRKSHKPSLVVPYVIFYWYPMIMALFSSQKFSHAIVTRSVKCGLLTKLIS